MEGKLADITRLFQKFKAAYDKNDTETSDNILSQLKAGIVDACLEKRADLTRILKKKRLEQVKLELHGDLCQRYLSVAGDILEHAVVLSVKMEDQDAFERHFLQLKSYYTDTRGVIPPSGQEYPILGLNLLRLLVQNRIAEFHTELELLPPAAHDHSCIKHAVELEQSFMEGAYNRVLSARQAVPHETYVYFMDLLAKTVRDEIAGCSEKAYDSLSLVEAKKILMFASDQELLAYVLDDHPDWEIRGTRVYFQRAKKLAPCKEIPSLQLINQTLGYARELERIV
nr:26S proteasome non-ATPase regulatory subunit 8 homolog A-like isoform X1 [Physcomitrium patens]|eukprot:XP_024401401.1 26S proteasome non-ATPase regulatory subunit 8 homolog A-like isoform X1 [Physcomitrella patens]